MSLKLNITCWTAGAILLAATTAMAATPQALSMGGNVYGQTGQDTETGATWLPTFIDTSNIGTQGVKGISAGWEHSLLLSDDGTVYAFGRNNRGQTGLATTTGNTLVATAIDDRNLTGVSITQVSAGQDHSLILGDNGQVYAFGSNANGRTGLTTTIGNTTFATAIDTTNLTDVDITQVAAGLRFSLILGDNGVVYSFGDNSGGRTAQNIDSGNTVGATAINTTHVDGKTITFIAAGETHGVIVDSDGVAYSFGNDGSGRTGQNLATGSTLVATPVADNNLDGVTITRASAGFQHSLLLADDGDVYAFGNNGNGRTGLNTAGGSTLIATLIDMTNINAAADTIIDVAAGRDFSLLLADSGTVYGFGSNELGQLGFDDTTSDVLIATAIDTSLLPAGFVFSHIAAGKGGLNVSEQHSLLIGVIPEPSSLLLLGVGGLLVISRRRRAAGGV